MGLSSFGFCLLFLIVCPFVYATVVSHDGRAITINGQRKIFLSGSIHYPRSTPEMWPDLIRKAKAGGLDTIETYVFWNVHEPSPRQYDFSGNLDLIRFIKTIQSEGLYVVLRIGPYVCAEWTYGGFPMWLHNIKDIKFRTMNQAFMNEVQTFTTYIVDMVKKEKLFASQGGPIILAQTENEYGNIMAPYGEAGKEYIKWSAKMAESLNIGVPWIMCQQADAPQPMINTCNGFYCDKFKPNNPNSPKMWTENWTGWFKPWGGATPHRTAEDLAFSVARFYQYEGTFQNYYMYHGGTNFGRTSGGPYLTTSYDYDAPLNEYGDLNQPKYGHLKQLHNVLKSMEKTLTYGNISHTEMGNGVTVTKYATKEISSCFIGNANDKNDATVNFEGTQYNIPAWSVSILPDCKKEVYNTARVNTQTSIMVKRADKEQVSLRWSWRPENTNESVFLGKGDVSLNQLVDQKVFDDTSDYLWYMTSVNIRGKDKLILEGSNTSISVNGTGHVFHAYVNGEYIGSQWGQGPQKVWEKQVKLRPGKNVISLLSATVGYGNYGEFFDEIRAGILGPVQLVGRNGDNVVIKDLATNKWNYRIGLNGFDDELFTKDSRFASQWQDNNLSVNKTMVWYKTTFKAPLGSDPVVVDLQGMGKGEAWVNGKSLGRYWPSYIADKKYCTNQPCDYRGEYHSEKCAADCEQPSQRWYHVPRSFLISNDNTLVLFEEFGGNISNVSFQTVSTGTICGNVHENNKMELSCQGRQITAIRFASFGDAQGTCGSFRKGTWDGENVAISVLQKECVGKESCSVEASDDVFGPTKCNGTKRLVVEAVC